MTITVESVSVGVILAGIGVGLATALRWFVRWKQDKGL